MATPPDRDAEAAPDPAVAPALRASDADREHAAELLRQGAADGRLTVQELDERLHAAYRSRTRVELEGLVADIVAAPDERPFPDVARSRGRVPVVRGEGGTRWVVAIMSGVDRKGRWRLSRSCMAINVMGGSTLDLNDAELADDVVELRVLCILGGAEIRVPERLDVEVSEFALMGGHDVAIGAAHPDPGGPLLRIKMFSLMGAVDVRRGRKKSRQERRREREDELEQRRRRHLGL